MRWEVKEGKDYRRDAKMVYKSTGTLPKAWRDKPEVGEQYEWVMTAFFELTSCRQVGFGVGPIPWTAYLAYSEYMELSETEFYFMKRCLSEMDTEYITLMSSTKKTPGKKGPLRSQ